MGSGADRKKKHSIKKGNIKTLDQKPKEKEADFDINKKPEPVKVAEAEKPCGVNSDYIKDLIHDLEDVRKKYSALFDHCSLEICNKTLQRLIDRLKAIGE